MSQSSLHRRAELLLGPGPARRYRRLLALLVCLAVAAPAPGLAPGSSSDLKQTEARQQLQGLRREIKALRERLESDRSEYGRSQVQLQAIEQRGGEVRRRLQALDRALRGHIAQLDTQEANRGTLEAELQRHRDAVARHVRAAYAMGRQEYLKLLLNQEQPATVGRILAYYGYLTRARAERIAAIREQVARIEKLKRSIERAHENIRLTRVNIAREQRSLDSTHSERRDLLRRLAARVETGEQSLARSLEDAERLEQLLAGIQQAMKRMAVKAPVQMEPFPRLRGHLQWPVTGRVLAGYGSSRGGGRLRWQGMLIGAPEGTEVAAVARGRVVFADWLRGFGLLTIIDHGDGYMSLYGHNETLLRRAGDWVETGDAVATVGASGGQPRAGLYFEIRRQGRPTNPTRWLVARGNQ